TAGPDRSTCVGDPVALLGADGGSGDRYAWSDGGGGGTFTPSATVEHPSYSNVIAGTYTLTFTSTIFATGCASSDTVQVVVLPRPTIFAGIDKRTCAGDAV